MSNSTGSGNIAMAGRALPPCPPFMLAAALLLWGYSNGLLLLGIMLAITLEGATLISTKVKLVDTDRNRLCDLTILTLLLLSIQQFYSSPQGAVFNTMRLLPLLLAPILFVQCWSQNGNFRYSSLFWSVRITERRFPQWDYGRINLRLPYVCICLVAASMHVDSGILFVVSACIISVWLLWPQQGYNWQWLVAVSVAMALAIAGQSAVLETREILRPLLHELTANYMKHRRNPWSSKPHLNSISRLKASSRIALRAEPDPNIKLPLLLHEASYDTFSGGRWQNSRKEFTEIDASSSESGIVWQWQSNCVGPTVDIQFRLTDEVSIVPLPHQACLIERLPAVLHRNPYGTARLTFQKGWVNYRSRLDSSSHLGAAAPGDRELHVPANIQQELQQFIQRLGLAQMQPVEAIAALHKHFIGNFKYSIEPQTRFRGNSLIGNFLLHERRGHCEYFATSTTMILRQLGIPTRYAVGFALSEYSPLEGKYIARGRHAHAWTLAWLDGNWQIVDTTPPGFFAIDKEQAPTLQWAFDIIELLLFEEIDIQKLLGTEESQTRNLVLTLLPLSAFLLWRLRRRKNATGSIAGKKFPGYDSPFYEITRWLEKAKGQARPAGQTQRLWIGSNWPELEKGLLPLLALHYRLRFSKGDQSELRQQLHHKCTTWLRQYASGKH